MFILSHLPCPGLASLPQLPYLIPYLKWKDTHTHFTLKSVRINDLSKYQGIIIKQEQFKFNVLGGIIRNYFDVKLSENNIRFSHGCFSDSGWQCD